MSMQHGRNCKEKKWIAYMRTSLLIVSGRDAGYYGDDSIWHHAYWVLSPLGRVLTGDLSFKWWWRSKFKFKYKSVCGWRLTVYKLSQKYKWIAKFTGWYECFAGCHGIPWAPDDKKNK